MKKAGVIIILAAMLLLSLSACGTGNKGTDGKPSENTGSQNAGSTTNPQTKEDTQLFEKMVSEYGIGVDKLNNWLYWSPKGNFVVFEGFKDKGETDEDYAVVVADLKKGTMKKIKNGYLYGKPSWNAEESMAFISLSDGLYSYSIESGDVSKISDKGYKPEVSPDGKKVIYMSDGLWVYDLEGKSTLRLTKGKYDTAPIWFSDSKRIFYFRDNGKNLGDGAGNQQEMSILDIEKPEKNKEVLPAFKGKFRSAQWLVQDDMLHIYAGWDDGHMHYILNLKNEKIIDVDSTQLYQVAFNKKDGIVLKAKDDRLEIYDFEMKKLADGLIDNDSEYEAAEYSLGHAFLSGNKVIYLHVNQQDNKGAMRISYLDGSGKQTRIGGYSQYSIPFVSEDLSRVAFFEGGNKLRIVNISDLKETQIKGIPSKNRALSELLTMFPDRVGTEWIYNGFAEYGHQMTIDGISVINEGKSKYLISGKVADMSDGEATGDFSLYIEYEFSNSGLREIIKKGDKLPHKIMEFDVLRAPLNKGNTWKQDVKIGAKETELIAEIIDVGIEPETNKKIVKVQYTAKAEGMPDGIYKEVRTFKEGTGLVMFENTFNEEIEFNYSLFHMK